MKPDFFHFTWLQSTTPPTQCTVACCILYFAICCIAHQPSCILYFILCRLYTRYIACYRLYSVHKVYNIHQTWSFARELQSKLITSKGSSVWLQFIIHRRASSRQLMFSGKFKLQGGFRGRCYTNVCVKMFYNVRKKSPAGKCEKNVAKIEDCWSSTTCLLLSQNCKRCPFL